MHKFRLIIAVITSVLLGLAGWFLASVAPLPEPTTLAQTRILYVLLGVLSAQLIFTRISSWILHTTTDLFRQLVVRISSEVTNQLSHLASAGLHLRRESSPDKITNPVILDTSALIDGRVLEVARSGFISGMVLIPEFVLRELQQVADSSDGIKRLRGRRGFEIVEGLKKIEGIKLQLWEGQISGKSVDEKLTNLGKSLRGRVLTVDYNLNRVASLSSVRVLNLNELGNSLKTLPVPGESLKIKLVHLGKDDSQGVGYLSDGTMVVVGGGARELGKTVEVEVTKLLQGPAGRMVFGKI